MHRRSLRRQRTDRTKRPDGRYDTDEADGDDTDRTGLSG